jgi:hypothetical protein
MSKYVRSLLPAMRIFDNESEAPRPAPPPPRFARYASSSGPPPPLARGRKRGGARDASASELDAWRSVIGELVSTNRFTLCFSFPSQKKKGSGTPTNAGHHRRILRCGTHPAGRARLSAFHHGSHLREYSIPKAQLQARLPGTRSVRALPAFACPSPGKHLPSRSSCREADTQAAREQTANPPAGTAPAPPFGLPPEGVLRESGINSYVIKVVTNVNRKGTPSEASPARGGL